MLKKVISVITGLSALCAGIFTIPNANAVQFELSADCIIDGNEAFQATEILSPDEIPINEKIKDLDEKCNKSHDRSRSFFVLQPFHGIFSVLGKCDDVETVKFFAGGASEIRRSCRSYQKLA